MRVVCGNEFVASLDHCPNLLRPTRSARAVPHEIGAATSPVENDVSISKRLSSGLVGDLDQVGTVDVNRRLNRSRGRYLSLRLWPAAGSPLDHFPPLRRLIDWVVLVQPLLLPSDVFQHVIACANAFDGTLFGVCDFKGEWAVGLQPLDNVPWDRDPGNADGG